MTKHFTIPLSTILSVEGMPLCVDFWSLVVDRIRKKRKKITKESAGEAIWELRKEAKAKLDAAEKMRQDAVKMFNDCRAVERDMATLLHVNVPALKARVKRSRAK